MAEALATNHGGSIDVVGHSYGGRTALGDGRIVVIEGARHAAHHTHPDAFADAIRTILP